jgi:hypothetical protein
VRIAVYPLGWLLLALVAACGGEKEIDQPATDSPTGRTVSFGCEVLPGFDTDLTPPPAFTSPFDCTPNEASNDPDYRDFGGLEGRISPIPMLPPDLVAVSDYYEFGLDSEEPAAVIGFALPLTEEIADPSTIGFFSYVDGEWRRIADVTVVLGMRAEGDFSSVPPNMAVLKSSDS